MAPLVHVGFHRAASTWLQRSVFRADTGGFAEPVSMGAVLQALVAPPGAAFAPGAARDALAPLLEAAAPKVPVISQERLTGYPHAGGRDAGELADRIAATLPDARVLLVVREQRAVTTSCYRLYVKVGGPLSPARYVSPVHGSTVRAPGFDLRQFDYHHLVERYRRHLGPDRVLVLPFEQLKADPLAFAWRIADFAEAARPVAVDTVARNAGLRGVALALKRHANRWLVRHALNPTGLSAREAVNEQLLRGAEQLAARLPERAGERMERALAADVDTAVAREADRIAASNRATARLLDVDLGALGYLV
jgi:hypothetical protein